MNRIRTAVSLCHRQPGPATALDFRLLDTLAGPAGHDATAFAGTLPGNRPGGAVLLFVRVGRAVLGVEDGGEWTPESIGPGVRHLVHADRDVVAAMCVFTRAGC